MNKEQQKIESLLFFKNEPVSFSWIGKQINMKISDVKSILDGMSKFYENRGISLVILEDKASLVTAESSLDILNKIINSKEEKELSRQSLETLSIILYKGLITKHELDYIRGVNSVFILRNLLIRGLIEKNINNKDKRSPLYSITSEAMSFLGIHKKEELPRFDYFLDKLNRLESDTLDNESIQ